MTDTRIAVFKTSIPRISFCRYSRTFPRNNVRFSAIARVGVANRSVDRPEHEISPGAHRPRNTERAESTALAVGRMVLHESQWQVRPLRETPCRQGVGVLGVFVQDQHIDLRHVSRWAVVGSRLSFGFRMSQHIPTTACVAALIASTRVWCAIRFVTKLQDVIRTSWRVEIF